MTYANNADPDQTAIQLKKQLHKKKQNVSE